MSLLFALHSGGVSLLASDSLHVWTNPDGSKKVVQAVKKIHKTPSGLIAGIGTINVFQPVIDEIIDNGYAGPADVIARLRASLDKIQKLLGASAAMSKTTAIMLSYGDPSVHLRSFHQQDDFVEEDLDGKMSALLPGSAVPGMHRVKLQAIATAPDPPAIIKAIRSYFRCFHVDFPQEVGPSFQFGVHTGETIQISDLIPIE